MRKLLTDMIFYTQVVDNVFMNLFFGTNGDIIYQKKVHKTLIINHLGIKIIIIDEKKAHVEIKRYTEKIGQCQ